MTRYSAPYVVEENKEAAESLARLKAELATVWDQHRGEKPGWVLSLKVGDYVRISGHKRGSDFPFRSIGRVNSIIPSFEMVFVTPFDVSSPNMKATDIPLLFNGKVARKELERYYSLTIEPDIEVKTDWDARWMDAAAQKGSWSKDRSRKVGAVIVNHDNVEVSNGWNGFPRKINDDVEARHQRPAKYLWSEHSERNAIYNAAREGRATKGCRIFQTMYPCAHCARGVVQAGIVEVITVEPDWDDPTYKDEFAVTQELLAEACVKVRFVEGTNLVRVETIT